MNTKIRTGTVLDPLGGLLLALVTALVYWPAIHGSFLWDDDVHLTANPAIVGPLGLKDIWTTAAAVYYPLTSTSFWLQHLLWGLNPLPYHLVNIALHATAAILLWRILNLLKVPGAWTGAALWAWHPVQVESVAWITELKNTQSGLFYMLAIWLFLKWREVSPPDSQRNAVVLYALSILTAALAILSKTSTVMLPLVLGLCWWWKDRRWRWRNAFWLAPFFLISSAAGVWTIWEQMHHARALGSDWSQTSPERLAIAGRNLWFYLSKLVWPRPLIFIYPRWTVDSQQLMEYIPAVAAALALLGLWRKRNSELRPLFFAFAYFAVSLFPVSGIFNIYFFRYSFVADHFQYLAAIGPLALAAAGMKASFHSIKQEHGIARFLHPALMCFLLTLCGILTWQQSAVYASPTTLWRDTLAENPNAWMAHTNLGAELDEQGRFSEAIDEYRAALRVNPNDAGAHNNLATHLARLGHYDEAISEWEHALEIQPDRSEVHSNLAYALTQVGRMPEAFQHWEQALKLKPDLVDAHRDFGDALAKDGRNDEAIAHYEQALRWSSDDADVHYRLASSLQHQRQFAGAIEHYRIVLKLEPQAVPAQNALAWLLATCPQSSLRNGPEAVRLALDANQRSGRRVPQILDTLAAAYAEAGQFEKAVESAQEALQFVNLEKSSSLIIAIENRLKLYRRHQAYHED